MRRSGILETARSKKLYDKRDDLKKKAMKRETERDFRNSQIKM